MSSFIIACSNIAPPVARVPCVPIGQSAEMAVVNTNRAEPVAVQLTNTLLKHWLDAAAVTACSFIVLGQMYFVLDYSI